MWWSTQQDTKARGRPIAQTPSLQFVVDFCCTVHVVDTKIEVMEFGPIWHTSLPAKFVGVRMTWWNRGHAVETFTAVRTRLYHLPAALSCRPSTANKLTWINRYRRFLFQITVYMSYIRRATFRAACVTVQCVIGIHKFSSAPAINK